MTVWWVHALANMGLIGLLWWLEVRRSRHALDGMEATRHGPVALGGLVMASILLDLDQWLLSGPEHCPVNRTPLHQWWMSPIYLLGTFVKAYAPFFWGVFLHLGLDLVGCQL